MTEDVELKDFQLPYHNKHVQQEFNTGANGLPIPPHNVRANSITLKQQHALQGSVYETYDPLREKWSYAIAIQAFLVYIVYLYYERINSIHKLLGCLLMGGQTSCMAQSINQLYKRQYNLNKHIKFYLWGLINGLLTIYWIEFLVAFSPKVAVRVLLDQVVGNPVFQLLFIVFDSVWDRADVVTRIKTNYITTCKISFLYWPFVSMVSFGIMREDLIFPFNCFVSLVWSVVLAVIN